MLQARAKIIADNIKPVAGGMPPLNCDFAMTTNGVSAATTIEKRRTRKVQGSANGTASLTATKPLDQTTTMRGQSEEDGHAHLAALYSRRPGEAFKGNTSA